MKAFKFGMSIYLKNIIAIFISAFLVVPLFTVAEKLPFLYSSVTALIYFGIIYSHAWNYGRRDARNIPGFSPDMKLPVKAAAIAAVIPAALLIFRIINPDIWRIDMPFMMGEYDFFVSGCKITSTPDLIYRLWYYYFAAFIPSGSIAAYTAVIFVQPIIIIVGYAVGLRRFSMLEFFSARVVFSQNPNDKNKNKKKREDSFRR